MNPGMKCEVRRFFFDSVLQNASFTGTKSMMNHPVSFFGIFTSALVSEESGSMDSFSVRSFRFT